MAHPRAKALNLLPAALLAAATLVACVQTPRPEAARMSAPPQRPDRPAPALTETPKSAAARAYYAQVQRGLLAQGLLRTDGGGIDTPFDDRMLAENFTRIALFDEYSRDGAGFVRGEAASVLRRWQEPIRFRISFGASVPADRQATDRARIASYLARLSQITGHPISLVDRGGNFVLHIVSEDEREALGAVLRRDMPGLSPRDVADVTHMAQTTYCMVYALSEGDTGRYSRAVAVVRSEHPDLLRQSCLHEEIAQGLGLANDSPRARPSIFNDDEEFALLTRQDELMLKMLYNPELRPGMTEAEARPIIRRLAAQWLGGA